MKLIHFQIFFILLLLFSNQTFSQGTEVMYLSGTDKDNTVDWEFFCNDGRNSGHWSTIPVPSCWEQYGFGTYNYGRDKNPANEYGKYRYRFSIPAEWLGKHIEIVFEGSMTDTEVKINGQKAGPVHQGAFYRFTHNITDLVKTGENVLEVTVWKRSSNESVNNAERRADYWVFGGIFRPVYLRAFPTEHIERTAIDARADGAFLMDVFLRNADQADSVSLIIQDITGKSVGRKLTFPVNYNRVEVKHHIHEPKLWTAETPNLYQAIVHLQQGNTILHTVYENFGFRTIEVRRGEGIFLNGQRIKIMGVNRHSFWPQSGRTLSKQLNIADVNLIKEMNMNAVRMSHYPPDADFLDACDSLGLYVLDELAGWHDAYDTAVGEKLVREMITRDVNHPSIIFWNNGNENGNNQELDDDFHKYDPQKRIILYPWDTRNGVNTSHYQTFEMYLKLAEGPDILLPTEIWHGLYDGGHAAGTEDFWKAMYDKPLVAGFFCWVLTDDGIVRTDQNRRIDTDGNHAPDGIVGPYREKEGSFFALKETLAPVHISLTRIDEKFDGKIPVENRYDFTNLNQCSFEYWLADYPLPQENETGYRVVKLSRIEAPSIAPHECGFLETSLPQDFYNHDALFLKAIDPFGREIITRSFPITKASDIVARIIPPPKYQATGSEENGIISVTAGRLKMQFNKGDGILQSVNYDGTDISLHNGPRLSIGGVKSINLKHYVQGKNYVIDISHVSGNFKYMKWTIMGNEWVKLDYGYEPYGYYDALGISFQYPEEKVLSKKWLGNGPFRVWKNRQSGNLLNVWHNKYNNTITGVTYDYPEFKGYFSNVYWGVIETTEKPITIVIANDNLYLRVFTPENGPAPRGAVSVFPRGDISILHEITPIGTKINTVDNTGPSGLKNHANGLYEGTVYFFFG